MIKIKNYLAVIAFCLSSTFILAQSQGKIKGKFSDGKNPLEFVTISLSKTSDSTKIAYYTNSDSAGFFLLEKIELGEYLLKANLLGYVVKTQKVALNASKNTLNLATMQLNEDTKLLQTVTVTAQKRLIEKTPQGFIVNAAANLTQAGGTATDLLKNTPTVNVDAEGGITLRGKTPMFLINGRNSSITNLDQIAASSIETIEIINNASAKYDANAEGGIINIKLKKNKSDGTNGTLVLGVGKGDQGRVSSAILLNHKTKKWNFGIGYDNRFAGRIRTIEGGRTNYFLPDNYSFTQNRDDNRLEQLQNVKLNLDFSPNEKHSFSLEMLGNVEGQDNHEDLHTLIRKQNNDFVSNTDRFSLEIERVKEAEFDLGYKREFANKRKSLSANITSSFNIERQNTAINSQSFFENKTENGAPFFDRTHNYENGNISNIIVNYEFPIAEIGQIETGYKGTFRQIISDYETAQKVNDVFIPNVGASNIFNFKEKIQAFYAQYNSFSAKEETTRWKYTFGLRAEQVNNNGSTQTANSEFNNNYLKLFPTAQLSYYFSPESYWKLSYGKRINRPGLGQLNPFIDITDALNPHGGNSKLKPEIAHNLELGFNKEWEKASVSSNVFYRYAFNTIRQYSQLQPNGANLSLPINIGNASTYGWENILTLRPAKFYDLNASVSLFQQHINGDNVATDAVQNAFGWYGKLIQNFVPMQGAKLQVIANYNSATITPQGQRNAQYFVDLGFQQKLFKDGKARLGLTVVDVFNTLKSGFSNTTTSFSNFRYSKADTRAVMLTFGYSFKSTVKDKAMENRFSRE
jgi:outer membrane receptor protein involved in Fe transport